MGLAAGEQRAPRPTHLAAGGRARGRRRRAPGLTDWQEEGRRDESFPEPEPAGPVIDLADLMLDQNGEVVLFNDSNLRSLTLRAGARLERERAQARVVD